MFSLTNFMGTLRIRIDSIKQTIEYGKKRFKEGYAAGKAYAKKDLIGTPRDPRVEPETVRAADPKIRQHVQWRDGWYHAQVWHKDQEKLFGSHPGLGEGFSATPQGALRNALDHAGLEIA